MEMSEHEVQLPPVDRDYAPWGFQGESDEDDFPDGRWEKRSKDGTLKRERDYENGIQHGVERDFHQDGTLALEMHWERGYPVGTARAWHESGTLAREWHFSRGEPHGTLTTWFADGEIESASHYQHGTLHGDATAFLADGSVESRTRYRFGVPGRGWADLFWRPRLLAAVLVVLAAIWLSGHGKALLMLLVLQMAILVHEAGHWLAARLVGIPVETFRVGVGPVVAAVRVGSTRFELAAIPVLGFVSPFSMRPSEFRGWATENDSEPIRPSEEQDSVIECVSRPRRSVFFVGGVVVNFLLAWLVLWMSSSKVGPLESARVTGGIVVTVWVRAPAILGSILSIDLAEDEDKGFLRALENDDEVDRNRGQSGKGRSLVPRLLWEVVVLNAVLAGFNLFPFPGLDGYHLALLSVEMIIRRPLPKLLKNSMGCVSVLFILGLVLVSFLWFFRDIYQMLFG